MSSSVGLDKLGFFFPAEDVAVSPDCPARVGSSVNAATGESMTPRVIYRDTSGREVRGSVASLNTPNYNFDIKPAREAEGSIARLHFSASAFSKNNFEPLDRDRTVEVVRRVQDDLAEHGVELDLSRAKLFRVDVAKNVVLSRPVACFAPALAAAGASKRTRKLDFGGTGFVVGNKSWEIACYDKGEEMKEKGYDPAECPVNSLRAELRFMKTYPTCVRDVDRTVPNLLKGWKTLEAEFNQAMRREVFRPKLEKAKKQAPDFDKLADEVTMSQKRQPWQWFKSEAMLMLLVEHYGLEGAKNFAATKFGFDASTKAGKRQIERMHAELERAAFAVQMAGKNENGDQILALYEELSAKILG